MENNIQDAIKRARQLLENKRHLFDEEIDEIREELKQETEKTKNWSLRNKRKKKITEDIENEEEY